jgi:hypothetical protein
MVFREGDRRLGAGALLLLSLAGCDNSLGKGAAEDQQTEGGDGDQGDSDHGDGDSPSGDGDGDDGDSTLVGETPGGVEVTCDRSRDLAVTPLLKLSTTQYKNTIRDLLAKYGLTSLEAAVETAMASIPDDSLGDGFRGLDDRVALEHVQGYFNVGVVIGDALAADPALLAASFPGCTGDGALSSECWDAFASSFLTTVYRRPLGESEAAFYDSLKEETTSESALIRAAVIVALSSPRFVYHVEINGEALEQSSDILELDAYEVAARLSYTFWQTMPDEQLFQAAADGSLLEDEVYGAELLRIWQDPRTEATLRLFWSEWLKLEKFTGFETERPAFQSLAEGTNLGVDGHDYYADMMAEVHDLAHHFTFEEPSALADLLRTNISVTQSEDLAALYGVPAWDGSGDFPTFDPGERAGLLQRAALLVSNLEQTNPFHRGALIRRAVLCDPLPQPDPNDLPPGALDPPPFDSSQTTRERFQAKVEGNSLCEGCHNGFSEIGYVMESYDALGRFRTVERVFDEQSGDLLDELPIVTSGDVRIAAVDEPPVSDAAEMNERIAASGKVEACLAQSYFKYAARRVMSNNSYDSCVIEDLSAALAQENGGLAAAFQRIARVSTFFTKKVGPK